MNSCIILIFFNQFQETQCITYAKLLECLRQVFTYSTIKKKLLNGNLNTQIRDVIHKHKNAITNALWKSERDWSLKELLSDLNHLIIEVKDRTLGFYEFKFNEVKTNKVKPNQRNSLKSQEVDAFESTNPKNSKKRKDPFLPKPNTKKKKEDDSVSFLNLDSTWNCVDDSNNVRTEFDLDTISLEENELIDSIIGTEHGPKFDFMINPQNMYDAES